MGRGTPRCWKVAALVGVLGWGGVACGVGMPPPPPIGQASLVGNWASKEGVRIDFAGDHTLRGTGLDHALGDRAGPCPAVTMGRWEFFGPMDDSGSSFTDESLTRGGVIALDGEDDACTLLAVTGREGRVFSLCLGKVADHVCTNNETLYRSRP